MSKPTTNPGHDLRAAAQRALVFAQDIRRGKYKGDAAEVIDELSAVLAQQEQEKTCNCRWVGDVQTQQCTLHEAHVAAIHEWAERAKAAEAAQPQWVLVSERKPTNHRPVLAHYKNKLGNSRIIRAEWIAAKTVEADEESDNSEHDEATDTHYVPEGWYERINNWDDYSSVRVYDGDVTHWMLLPEAP
jgi:hypothetical protein